MFKFSIFRTFFKQFPFLVFVFSIKFYIFCCKFRKIRNLQKYINIFHKFYLKTKDLRHKHKKFKFSISKKFFK